VSGTRRTVRASAAFFHRLDRLLPSERSGGLPSRADFEASELLRAVEEFATAFDALPELIRGRPDYRVLIARGRLVYAYSIVGQLAADGAVELVGIDIEVRPPTPATSRTPMTMTEPAVRGRERVNRSSRQEALRAVRRSSSHVSVVTDESRWSMADGSPPWSVRGPRPRTPRIAAPERANRGTP